MIRSSLIRAYPSILARQSPSAAAAGLRWTGGSRGRTDGGSSSGGGGGRRGASHPAQAAALSSSWSAAAAHGPLHTFRVGDEDDNGEDTNDGDGESTTTAWPPARQRFPPPPPSRREFTAAAVAFPFPTGMYTAAPAASTMGNPPANSAFSIGRGSIREYSSTPQREILPLVALVIGGLTVRYSYKALRRMDREWEEYQEALDEYRREHGDDALDGIDVDFDDGSYAGDAAVHATKVMFKGGTLGIDLGTVNVRCAHDKPSDRDAKLHVVVDRDGGRSTPNMVYFNDDDGGGGAVTGRLASSKALERGGVLNPHSLLLDRSADASETEKSVDAVIRSAARNALEQSLGGHEPIRSCLFALDAGTSGGYNARPVFTYPPPPSSSSTGSSGSSSSNDFLRGYLPRYERAVSNLSAPSSIAVFVPEPIAAMLGAVELNVMPKVTGTAMVIDVGGTATSVALVSPSKSSSSSSESAEESSSDFPGGLEVTHYSRLEGLGGETLIDALVTHLVRSFFAVRSAGDVNDGMALQRLYDSARSAVLELGSGGKDRVQINIPYLTVDEKMQPRHLDMGVGRAVLEQELTELVTVERAERYREQGVLSESMGSGGAKDLPGLLSSLVMRTLEEGGTNPFELERILLVGGGTRSPIYRTAVEDGLAALGGPRWVEERLVVPGGELAEELVVLGAAVAGRDA